MIIFDCNNVLCGVKVKTGDWEGRVGIEYEVHRLHIRTVFVNVSHISITLAFLHDSERLSLSKHHESPNIAFGAGS